MQSINSFPYLKRFPYWLRRSVGIDGNILATKDLLRSLHINTVCEEGRCPNIYDCFSRKRCTFLILGRVCTRNCRFCSVEKDKDSLSPPQKEELFGIREVVVRLGIRDVIITSVTRDDLEDGGASHFAECIKTLKEFEPDLNIEALVPDFLGKKSSIEKVVFAGPKVFSHNIETVERLYRKVRPDAHYRRSLEIIRYSKELHNDLATKSGLMVGLGETREEIYFAMSDLKEAGCDIITIGQYLKPAPHCLDAEEFIEPEEFARFAGWAKTLGFKRYLSGPFVRSSYRSGDYSEAMVWQS